MSLPTVTCRELSIQVGHPVDPPQFNAVRVFVDSTNEPWITYFCDPNLSTFVPEVSPFPSLSQSDFVELWPLLILLFVVAFGVRVLRGML